MKIRFSISQKIILLLSLMLGAAIVNVGAVYYYQKAQEHDAHIVNVAGRQRMLSQKITKFILSVAEGNNHHRRPLEEAIRLYDVSLEILHQGGDVMGEYIPPAPSVTEGLFKKNKAVWKKFKEKAEIVVKKDRDNPSFSGAVLFIKKNDEILLKRNDNVVSAYENLPNAEDYGHEINLAGRQRMLSQKISKHALSIAAGEDEERRKLREAIELYENSFLAMRDGGISIPWGKDVRLPPLSVQEALAEVEDIWYKFKTKAEIIQKEFRRNKSFREAVDYLVVHDEELLKVSNEVTLMFDGIFTGKAVFLKILLIALLNFDLFIFFIGYILSRRITEPIRELSLIAAQVGKGDLSAKAEYKSRDEIGDLCNVFNKMTDDLTLFIKKEKEFYAVATESERKRVKELASLNEKLESRNIECRAREEEIEAEKAGLVLQMQERIKEISELKEEVKSLLNELGRG